MQKPHREKKGNTYITSIVILPLTVVIALVVYCSCRCRKRWKNYAGHRLEYHIGESLVAEQVALPIPGTLESIGDAQQRHDLTKQRRTKSFLEQNRKEQQCSESRPATRQPESIRITICDSPAKVHKYRDVIQNPIPPCVSKLEEIRRVPIEINRPLLSLSPSNNEHTSYKMTKKYHNRSVYIPNHHKQRKAAYRRGTASTSVASRSACSSMAGSAEETMSTDRFGAAERVSLSS